jgi:hypothetical protein
VVKAGLTAKQENPVDESQLLEEVNVLILLADLPKPNAQRLQKGKKALQELVGKRKVRNNGKPRKRKSKS